MSTRVRPWVVAGAVFFSGIANASPDALWVQPSTKWYGIDGNWSAVSLSVGNPAQAVDVTVSTSLSEIWVVETTGCSQNVLCTAARGNVYNKTASPTWMSIGAWQLGLDYLGLGGNGDYALETVAFANSAVGTQASSTQQTVAAINDTDYFTGFFGLGITTGRFREVLAQSPIANLVEHSGAIPSHSYGYTAGAYYRGPFGTPLSLTLGGYDANRLKPHGTSFSLNSTTRQPEVLLRGITASMSSSDKVPKTWSSPALPLMAFNESATALIDSSTPYLWLPAAACDRFAQALNLTWNETLGVYLFSSNIPYEGISMADLSFTFTLSSFDNHDNFGQPLNVSSAVNITTSANAFSQTLRYPFKDVINYGDAALPYFPLKRVENGNRVILGRSFLQEAYLVTNYEKGSFSVHEALFPADPQGNVSIVTITSSPDSPYPGNPNPSKSDSSDTTQGLTKPQIIGVAIGAFAIGIAMIVLLWCSRHKSNPTVPTDTKGDEWMYDDSVAESNRPRSSLSRFLSKIVRNLPGNKGQQMAFEVDGTSRAIEAPANERTVRYEMAVPTQPVELEAVDTFGDDATQFGADDAAKLSAYEAARRKLHRQLQGPVPAYSGPALPPGEPEKGMQDVSPVAHYRPSDQVGEAQNVSAVPDPLPELSCNAVPSPTTPYGDWQAQHEADLPSPLTSGPGPSPVEFNQNTNATLGFPFSPDSYGPPPVSYPSSPVDSTWNSASHSPIPLPAIQRTPIDPSNIVCLGPLPNNIKLPLANKPSVPRLVGPDGQDVALDTSVGGSEEESHAEWGSDTLGSNFTLDQQSLETPPLPSLPPPVHAASRIDGIDLVHVPQPAPNRYSWEQDR